MIHQEDTRLLTKLLKWGTTYEKRNFLKSYWLEVYPEETGKMYTMYTILLEEVHDLFYDGFGYGFETDRGRIYIRYGKPNDIIRVEDDPMAFPYEIWTYEELPGNGQGNVKFLFYNEHLAGNAFRLLHSTAIGELSNPRWEIVLYSNAPDEIDKISHPGIAFCVSLMGITGKQVLVYNAIIFYIYTGPTQHLESESASVFKVFQ